MSKEKDIDEEELYSLKTESSSSFGSLSSKKSETLPMSSSTPSQDTGSITAKDLNTVATHSDSSALNLKVPSVDTSEDSLVAANVSSSLSVASVLSNHQPVAVNSASSSFNSKNARKNLKRRKNRLKQQKPPKWSTQHISILDLRKLAVVGELARALDNSKLAKMKSVPPADLFAKGVPEPVLAFGKNKRAIVYDGFHRIKVLQQSKYDQKVLETIIEIKVLPCEAADFEKVWNQSTLTKKGTAIDYSVLPGNVRKGICDVYKFQNARKKSRFTEQETLRFLVKVISSTYPVQTIDGLTKAKERKKVMTFLKDKGFIDEEISEQFQLPAMICGMAMETRKEYLKPDINRVPADKTLNRRILCCSRLNDVATSKVIKEFYEKGWTITTLSEKLDMVFHSKQPQVYPGVYGCDDISEIPEDTCFVARHSIPISMELVKKKRLLVMIIEPNISVSDAKLGPFIIGKLHSKKAFYGSGYSSFIIFGSRLSQDGSLTIKPVKNSIVSAFEHAMGDQRCKRLEVFAVAGSLKEA